MTRLHSHCFRSFRAALTGALAIGGGHTAAMAQSDQPLAGTSDIQSIVVTARRHDEELVKVPESVSVFDAKALADFDIQSFDDYATKTPNLTFSYGSGGTAISNARTIAIRGITGQNLFGTSGATGFYVDNTPLPESIDPRVIDLDRIEILKGPQGTLFGESSLAGNVRLITNRPSLTEDSASVSAQAGASEGGGSPDGGIGMVANDVVVPGSMAVRVVFFANHDAGYLSRTYPSPNSPAVADPALSVPRTRIGDQGAQSTAGGSATLRITSGDSFEARLRLMVQTTYDNGFPSTFAPLPAFRPVYTEDRAYDLQPYARDTWFLPSLELEYRASGFTLYSTTSYFNRHNRDVEDSTYGTQQILRGYYGVPNLPNQPFLWEQDNRQSQTTQEFRVETDAWRDLQGSAGLFLAQSHATLSVPATYANGLVQATTGNQVIGPWPNNLLWTDNNPGLQEDASLFGEVTWRFLPDVSLTAGLRQYWLRQKVDFTANGFNNGGPTVSDPQTSQQHGINPRLALSWDISDSETVYASASEGFRAGAAQPYLPFCALSNLPVDAITHLKSDTLWNYEVGGKAQIPGTGLLVSAAAFDIDWHNPQQQVALPCGAYFDINGGRARIDGGEFEVSGHLAPSLELRLGAGYERTRITDPGALSIVGITSGMRVLGVPAWSVTASARWSHPLTATLTGFIEGDYGYTGSSTALLNSGSGTIATRAAYSLANLHIGVQHDSDTFAVAIRNVTDARPNLGDLGYVGYAQFTSSGSVIPQVATLPPRTVLLQVHHDL